MDIEDIPNEDLIRQNREDFQRQINRRRINQVLPYQPDNNIELEENDMADKKYAYVVSRLYYISFTVYVLSLF